MARLPVQAHLRRRTKDATHASWVKSVRCRSAVRAEPRRRSYADERRVPGAGGRCRGAIPPIRSPVRRDTLESTIPHADTGSVLCPHAVGGSPSVARAALIADPPAPRQWTWRLRAEPFRRRTRQSTCLPVASSSCVMSLAQASIAICARWTAISARRSISPCLSLIAARAAAVRPAPPADPTGTRCEMRAIRWG